MSYRSLHRLDLIPRARRDATRRATRHCTARRRTNGRTHETRLVETRRDEKTPRALFSSALRLSLHVLDFPTPHQINIRSECEAQHTLEHTSTSTLCGQKFTNASYASASASRRPRVLAIALHEQLSKSKAEPEPSRAESDLNR